MKVFISSPITDLIEHRKMISINCADLSSVNLTMMENFDANTIDPKTFCRNRVAGHDLFILLLRACYGSRPEARQPSFTRIEYNAALELGIETLVFLDKLDSFSTAVTNSLADWKDLFYWRYELEKQHTVKYFTSADELGLLVRTSINNRIQAEPPPPPPTFNVKGFLELVRSDPLRRSIQKHFSSLRSLGFETPTNEDDFIQARRKFWSDIDSHKKQLISLLRQYIASGERTPDSFYVTYEFGRILVENRHGHLAYEVLGPLEMQMYEVNLEMPLSFKSRIIDGIGEAARFADDFTEAKRLYNAALGIDHTNYFALKHLGTIHRIDNDFPRARECFDKALRVRRTYHVLFSLAYLYHDLKHYIDAEPLYTECEQVLNNIGKNDYYRVYFKLACIHLILKKPNAVHYSLKTIDAIEAYANNPKDLDTFAQVTRFAAYLLISLVHDNKTNAIGALSKCEDYLKTHIDSLTHSVFYCAYTDIERVLAERIDLLPAVRKKLGSEQTNRLDRILDQLRLKHLLLQASVAQKNMLSLTVAADRIEVLVKPIENMGEGTAALKDAMRTFEIPPWRSPYTNQDPFETCKIAVASSKVAVKSMRGTLDSLLDRASLSIWLRCNTKERVHDDKNVLKPFTAVLPETLRQEHFPDHFYIKLEQSGAVSMARILGKKLLCLDPLTNSRVFINPTVGCKLGCEYCYLPEYSIPHNRKPTPAEIDGATFLAAIRNDSRVKTGKEGSLLSLGSFCEPFLEEVASLTVDILKELKPLGNSIQIATKRFPGANTVSDLVSAYADDPTQLMVNLSVNDLDNREWEQAHQWFEHLTNTNSQLYITLYIKPFLPKTSSQLSRFVEIGRKHQSLSFVVGSFYVGDSIRQMSSSVFISNSYHSNPSLVSPVVDEPKVVGFEEIEQEMFRNKLACELGRPVFKTASCALSWRRGVKDPLRNYETTFCLKSSCANYGQQCPSTPT